MTALWTFPWTVLDEGPETAMAALRGRGVDRLNVAAHYHSVQALQPRTPDSLFDQFPAGAYFEPDPERFAETPIEPLQNELSVDDPLATIVGAGAETRMAISGWLILFHNSRLGHEYPQFQLEDCFGEGHEHAFCPSHPEVKRYFAAAAGALADRGVDEIQLESYGFQNVLHSHDTQFGHGMEHALTSQAERVLLSQCFCDACRERANEHEVEIDRAQAVCRSVIEDSFDQPHSNPPPLATLVQEQPVLDDLFRFRAAVVTDLVAAIDAATPDTPLNGYVPAVDGEGFRGGWHGGVRLDQLDDSLDRVTAYCYVDDPVEARERIRTLARRTDLPIDAGVTLSPSVIERESQLEAIVDAIRQTTDGRVNIYNYSLATEAQLDWIEGVASEG
ncbi:hypothetical protein [Halovenus marina]|uniref:hypothetical protein n=1 Tax=Halovenus marina TaxID=3396621 RepID=UPI003F54C512